MYWTQGWLELEGPAAVLSKTQAACVVRHAEMCLAQCANPEPGRSPLPASVAKVITIKTLAELIASGSSDGDAAITCTIRGLLAAEFEHVIDPSMGDAAHQAALDKIHNATHSALPHDWSKPTQRC